MRRSRIGGGGGAGVWRQSLAWLLIVLVVRLVYHGQAADLVPAHGDETRLQRVQLRPDTCRASELALLPGIGIVQARALVAALRRGGQPADLLAIPGVGEVTLARLRPHVDLTLEASDPNADDRAGGSRAASARDQDETDAPAPGSDAQGDRDGARGRPGRAR